MFYLKLWRLNFALKSLSVKCLAREQNIMSGTPERFWSTLSSICCKPFSCSLRLVLLILIFRICISYQEEERWLLNYQ